MNADDFYEQFKDALKFLGPGWSGMDLVQVDIKGDTVNLSFENKTASIKNGPQLPR